MGTWTRNYYNLLTSLALADCDSTGSTPPTSYDPPIKVRDMAGNWYAPWQQDQYGMYGSSSNTQQANAYSGMAPFTVGKSNARYLTSNSTSGTYEMEGFQLGTGSNAESYEDYALQTPITSGITLASATGNVVESVLDGQHLKSKHSFTMTNSTASTITVSEIGVFVRSTANGGSPHWVLVYREVPDEPIELGPSESIILEFSKDNEIFNYTPYT